MDSPTLHAVNDGTADHFRIKTQSFSKCGSHRQIKKIILPKLLLLFGFKTTDVWQSVSYLHLVLVSGASSEKTNLQSFKFFFF